MASLSITWNSRHAAPARLGAAPWLAAASFATVTQALVVPGLLPEMAQALGVTVAQAGQATTAFVLAAALGALPLARLLAGIARARVVVGGLLVLAAASGLAALAPSLGAVLLLRALAGLAAGAVLPAAPALAADLAAPSGRVRALAAVTFGSTLAFALGLPATSLVGALFGWRAAFALAGLLAVLAALVLAAVLPAGAGAGAPQGGLRAALARPGVAPGLALVGLAFTSVFATQAFLGPVAQAAFGGGPALLQALMALGAILGVPAGAALAERFGARAPVAVALALLAAALWQWGLLAAGLVSPALQAGQVVFASAALFAVSPVMQARLVAAAGPARGLVLAANFCAVSAGQAAGASLGGLALGGAGLVGAAAVAVLAAALMLVLAARPAR